MPQNIVEFSPVDEMELWKRAKQAARCIIDDRIHGRELDGAFENDDGDEMCAALWRMALRGKKLKDAIEKAWKEQGVLDSFICNYEKFYGLTDFELSEHARQTRETQRKAWEERTKDWNK